MFLLIVLPIASTLVSMRKYVFSVASLFALVRSEPKVDDDDLFADINFDDLLKEDFASEGMFEDLQVDQKEATEANARRDFGEFDANKDGQLDPLEIRSRFKSFLNEQDLYYFYDNADKDRSGTVGFEEYLVYVSQSHEDYQANHKKL